MSKNVMLIGELSGFMVNAVKNGLTKEGYDVVPVPWDIDKISHAESQPNIRVIYLDGKMFAQEEIFIYLRDEAVENERRVFLIGSKEELEEAHKYLKGLLTVKDFERPFNVSMLAEVLEKEFELEVKALLKKKY